MKAMLFAGIMYKDKAILSEALNELEKEYGKTIHQGEEYDFNFTRYYEKEFGKNLKKRFVLFEQTIDPLNLADIKLRTIEIEDKYKVRGKRQVNIDPGYITSEVVVASTKKLPHRVSIGKEIFADTQITLNKEAHMFRHTFADYKKNINFFKNAVRLKQ